MCWNYFISSTELPISIKWHLHIESVSSFRNELLWFRSWWRHDMETSSALLALCEGNPPVTGVVKFEKWVFGRFENQTRICKKNLQFFSGFSWKFQHPIAWQVWDSPHKRPVRGSFDPLFDVCLNKWWNKQWSCQWFEMQWCSLWGQWNEYHVLVVFDSRHGHDNVIKWKHFPRYWPFVRGIHWLPVNSPHKGQRREF